MVFLRMEVGRLDLVSEPGASQAARRLECALEHRFALVVAPGGSGKTTLASRAVRSRPGSRWLSVREPSFEALALGLAAAFDLTGEFALQQAELSNAPATAFAAWFGANARAPLLVVDDLHLLGPEALALLRACMEQAAQVAHWLLLSREKPNLPIGSWMLAGAAARPLGGSDLRLDPHEVAQSSGVPLETARAAVEVSGGWAAGVSFALLALSQGCDLRDLAFETQSLCFDYFAGTLFADLERPLLEAALAAALVERVDVAFFAAAGFARPGAALEQLRARIGFLSPDGVGGWRMHDLVRAFFSQRLESDDDLRAAIPRRVLRALDAAGDAAEALRFATRFAPESLAGCLEREGLALLDRGRRSLIADALAGLPESERARPVLAGLRALLDLAGGAFERGLPALAHAVAAMSEPQRFAYARRLSLALLNRGDPRAIDAIAPYLERAERSDARQSCDVHGIAAMAVLTAHDLPSARRHADEALRRLGETNDAELFARTHLRAAYVAFYEGRSAECRHHAQLCLEEAERMERPELEAFAYGVLYSEAFGISKDYGSALWYAERAALAADRAGDQAERFRNLRAQYQIETMRGRPERLATLERELRSAYSGYRDELAYAESKALRLGWEGDFAQAVRLLAPLTVSLPTQQERIEVMCVLAFYAALDGRHDEAKGWTDRAGAIAYDPADLLAREYAATSTLYASMAHSLSGRSYAARRLLMARRELFVGEDAALFDAALALAQGTQPQEIRSVAGGLRAANFGGLAKVLAAYAQRIEARAPAILLTDAERGVLMQLAMGFSQREIAERTHRSYATIRTHVRSALQKLSCSSALAAVAKARTLDLIG
jgi:ATP/maltotriose-dependent transcriptional regulator MalT